jgi:hypothetical protein
LKTYPNIFFFQIQNKFLQDGYASHLNVLKNPNTGSRQASGNARLILKKFTFTNHQHQTNTNATSDETERANMNNANPLLSTSSTITSINNYNTMSSIDVHDYFVGNANTHSMTNSNATHNHQQNDEFHIKSQLSGNKLKK